MAECKIPVRIDGYKCVEDMAQAVLNYTYKGKTLKEWADSISEPQTNADRIRSMTDEELAKFVCNITSCEECRKHKVGICINEGDNWLDWLKQEARV